MNKDVYINLLLPYFTTYLLNPTTIVVFGMIAGNGQPATTAPMRLSRPTTSHNDRYDRLHCCLSLL